MPESQFWAPKKTPMDILLVSALLGSFFDKSKAEIPPPPPPQAEVRQKDTYEVVKSFTVSVTGYSSTEDQTDSTPFIAASGDHVYWGMVASNAYPFGTKLRFPELFGEKVFTVGDRMHERYQTRMDIWFPEYQQAYKFGLQKTKVEVVREAKPETLSMK